MSTLGSVFESVLSVLFRMLAEGSPNQVKTSKTIENLTELKRCRGYA